MLRVNSLTLIFFENAPDKRVRCTICSISSDNIFYIQARSKAKNTVSEISLNESILNCIELEIDSGNPALVNIYADLCREGNYG